MSPTLSAQDLLIRDVTVISPHQEISARGTNLLIRGGKIVRISDTPVKVDGHTQIIEANGKFLIPGLIDSHVHLAKVPSMTGRHRRELPGLAEAYATQQPRSYLYYGYTTVIDTNVFSPDGIRKFTEQPLHPDVYTCGQNLDLANGHGMSGQDPETRLRNNPNFLYDHYQQQIVKGDFDLTDHTPERTVTRIHESGAICVKTYYENGYGGSEAVNYDIPTPQIIKDVVTESRKRHLPVIIHANSWEAQRFALSTGVNIIGHGLWHWGEYRHETRVPPAIEATLKRIAKRQIGYQPTMHVIASQRDLFDPEYFHTPGLANSYPQALLDWYQTEAGGWFTQAIRQYFPDHLKQATEEQIYEKLNQFFLRIASSLKVLADSDANLLLGTDTVVGMSYVNPPGLSGYQEMMDWYEAGVSLKQILAAATISNARAFNLADDYGTIEAGKKANLLLLGGNPLENISAYDEIEIVILGGEAVTRDLLKANR